MTRISRDMIIAGVPAFEIRKLLRVHNYLVAGEAAETLGVPMEKAQEVMRALEKEDFLKEHDGSRYRSDGSVVWELTMKGRALRIAKAGKPIKRSTADKLVAEFLARVEQVNAPRSVFALRVSRVLAFGSYLTKRPDLGDIDLGVEVKPRWPEEGSYEAITRPRIDAAIEAGRHFSTYIDMLSWPEKEVDLFLKNRSRALSLTPASMIPEGAKTKLIYRWRRR